MPLARSALALLLLAGALARAAAAAAAPNPPELTEVRQVLNLSHAEAARHYPVEVTGVVTYCYFPPRGPWMLFVQDRSGGVFVSGPGARVSVGQRVRITGITDSGEFAPKIHRTGVAVLGTAPLPPAVRCPFDVLSSGKEDCQWVAINGIVRSARLREPGGDLLELQLASGGGRITALVQLDHHRNFAHLVDTEVVLNGVATTVLNRREQLLGVQVYTKGLRQVTVEAPAPADPFALPVSPIGNLLQFSRGARYGHRVKVVGIVTFRDRNGTLYLRDPTGALLVQTHDETPVAIGDELAVLGFPAAGSLSPYLEDATVRRTGIGRIPLPRPVSTAQLLDGRYDADLVTLEARVLETAHTLRQQILTVQSGDTVFTASLAGATPGKVQYPAGSLLRLTGICAITAESEHPVPKSFHLLLRSPADISVLSTPSWWTLTRLLRVLGLAVIAILVAFGWVFVVSRNNVLLREHRRIQQEILDISGREQGRIAQDLHDGVCQQLGAVAFMTKMLEEDLGAAAPEQAQAARDISRHLSDAITQTRTVAKGLLPVKLEENGLESALAELANHTTKLFRVACQFHCARPVALSDNEAARNLYYIAHEAVTNAVKHAQARRISIELESTSDQLSLRVTNDGRPFAPAADSRGMGLHIMKYRAQAIGASFSITANHGASCTVTCIRPLQPRRKNLSPPSL